MVNKSEKRRKLYRRNKRANNHVNFDYYLNTIRNQGMDFCKKGIYENDAPTKLQELFIEARKFRNAFREEYYSQVLDLEARSIMRNIKEVTERTSASKISFAELKNCYRNYVFPHSYIYQIPNSNVSVKIFYDKLSWEEKKSAEETFQNTYKRYIDFQKKTGFRDDDKKIIEMHLYESSTSYMEMGGPLGAITAAGGSISCGEQDSPPHTHCEAHVYKQPAEPQQQEGRGFHALGHEFAHGLNLNFAKEGFANFIGFPDSDLMELSYIKEDILQRETPISITEIISRRSVEAYYYGSALLRFMTERYPQILGTIYAQRIAESRQPHIKNWLETKNRNTEFINWLNFRLQVYEAGLGELITTSPLKPTSMPQSQLSNYPQLLDSLQNLSLPLKEGIAVIFGNDHCVFQDVNFLKKAATSRENLPNEGLLLIKYMWTFDLKNLLKIFKAADDGYSAKELFKNWVKGNRVEGHFNEWLSSQGGNCAALFNKGLSYERFAEGLKKLPRSFAADLSKVVENNPCLKELNFFERDYANKTHERGMLLVRYVLSFYPQKLLKILETAQNNGAKRDLEEINWGGRNFKEHFHTWLTREQAECIIANSTLKPTIPLRIATLKPELSTGQAMLENNSLASNIPNTNFSGLAIGGSLSMFIGLPILLGGLWWLKNTWAKRHTNEHVEPNPQLPKNTLIKMSPREAIRKSNLESSATTPHLFFTRKESTSRKESISKNHLGERSQLFSELKEKFERCQL